MFIPIKNLLPKVVKNSGFSRQIEAAQVAEKFNEIIVKMFGRSVLKKARVMHLKDKVLAVKCLSSVLVQEIYLREKKIINELNKKFGKEVVSKIKFRM